MNWTAFAAVVISLVSMGEGALACVYARRAGRARKQSAALRAETAALREARLACART
jgi:hypothetical protein